ncbi:ATP-dependent DNA helicase RecG [Rhodovarius sp.]|uniref:ATP-dependent DNA helicase RecG n=1 Tax=Rhodovarius sp. TaxID=2972673 RepID=UPI0034A226E3
MNHPVSTIAPILEAPLQTLPGIGPKLAGLLEQAVGGKRVLDLLLHLPERFAERVRIEKPEEAPADRDSVFPVLAESHRAVRSAKGARYVEVRALSGDARVVLRFMNATLPWIEGKLPRAEPRFICGRVRPEGDGFSVMNPEVARDAAQLPEREAIWPLVAGLHRGHVARGLAAALAVLPDCPEWADPPLVARETWPPFAAALRSAQAEATPAPRARLAYDEQLAGQIALALVRRRERQKPGRALLGNGEKRTAALAAFGHTPTPSQTAALAEIDADLAAPHRMLRLLQGDVGSGKTLVALLAMLRAVEAGTQAALMVPTELLARQHLRTLERLCRPAGVRVALLSGSLKAAERRQVLAGLADGAIAIAIGTHALFQQGVVFRDLGLAVVDEQHRFGVEQRLTLASKGEATDLLVMTATPIPRTLLLTHWGEMAVSRITGKPAGRQPIATSIHGLSNLEEVIAAAGRAMAKGARIYWVCPLVAESETLDLAAAETRFAELAARFGENVALAHGQMDVSLREAALGRFARGEAQMLVATTVIEVGVDVPEATVMVIEHAERFGLAQLHQLRGRVGRGAARSYCMLLYDEAVGRTARDRLAILRDTEDGFVIADEDFRLRGAGEALGTRQSGHEMARLPLDDAAAQDRLVAIAHADAEALLTRDPALSTPRGQAARLLLRLFGKDAAMATLGAG